MNLLRDVPMPECSQFKSYGKLVDGKIHFLGKHLQKCQNWALALRRRKNDRGRGMLPSRKEMRFRFEGISLKNRVGVRA